MRGEVGWFRQTPVFRDVFPPTALVIILGYKKRAKMVFTPVGRKTSGRRHLATEITKNVLPISSNRRIDNMIACNLKERFVS